MRPYWLSLLLVACVEPVEPIEEVAPLPPLETIDLAQLEGGTLLFQRVNTTVAGIGLVLLRGGAPSSATILTSEWSRFAVGPTISPSGTHVAYGVETDTAWDIHVSTLSGTDDTQVTTSEIGESPAAWITNNRIAFITSDDPQGRTAKFVTKTVLPTTGSESTVLTVGMNTDGTTCPMVALSSDLEAVSVSPTGGIAYLCEARELRYIAVGATAAQRLYAARERPTGTQTGPIRFLLGTAFSPAADRIAVLEATINNTNFQRVTVKLVPLTGAAPDSIASIPAAGLGNVFGERRVSGCWVSNNTMVVSVPDGSLQSHLYAVRMSTGVVTKLTTDPASYDFGVSCVRP